jgi:hypothetical protein
MITRRQLYSQRASPVTRDTFGSAARFRITAA